jgi:hypothetical protein
MEDARVRPLLRVLFDGKVQIIGGNDHRSLEIYDPAAGIFGAHAHTPPDGDLHADLINEIMASPTRAALLTGGQTITELTGRNQALATGGFDVNGNATSATTVYASSSASVTTDVLDYPPGTPVIITGRGFQPNEIVDLTFHEDPHTHTENVGTVQADANGNFTYDQYAPEPHDVGVTYILAAKGQSSGWSTQTTFHDGNATVTGSVKSTATGNPPINGATVSNSCDATITTTNASGVYSLNNVNFPGTSATCNITASAPGFSPQTITGVSVSNGGTVTVNFTLTPSCTAPAVTTQPSNQTVTYGSNATFNTSATGTPTPSLQWQVSTNGGGSWSNVGGATTSPLTITTPTVSQTGTQYRAAFTNTCGTVNSSAATLTVNPKTLTASIIGNPTKTYDGNTSATLTSANFSLSGLVGSDSFTVTKTTGSYNDANVALATTVTTSLAPGDFTPGVGTTASNYTLPTTAGGAGHITAAHPTLSTTGGTFTYDGNPHASTGTALGVDGVTPVSGSFSYTYTPPGNSTAPTDASATPYQVSAAFTSSDSNYDNGTAPTNSITINKADATINITPYSGVYDANPHSLTGTATGVGGADLSAGLNFGASFTDYPGGTATWTFSGGTNYNDDTGTAAVTINKASQTISWTNPAAIVYGTALSGTQLNATVAGVTGGSAPGALTYTPPTGTVLNAGNGQTLAVDAAATSNYNSAHKTVTIDVDKAPLTITASSHTITFNDPVPTITPSYLGFVAGDDADDLATPPTCSTTYTVGSLIGSYPSKCENAVSANYDLNYVNGTVTVQTACSVFNGFLPPIGGSVETGNGGNFLNPVRSFKLNSTIPVKFSAMCFGVPLTTGNHTLQAIRYSSSTASDAAIDATPTDAATTGNLFRFTDGEWHFNMNTKGFGNNGQGTWLLQATLFDGSKYTVWIAIKK